MIKKRLAMGAIALASVVGMAVGPVGGANAAVAHPMKSVQRNFSICGPGCVVIESGLRTTGPVTLRIGFRDQGIPGDRYRATYVDATTSSGGIVGVCAASSKTKFFQSLAVRVPSARNFKIRIRWCSGPGVFPAAGQMLILP